MAVCHDACGAGKLASRAGLRDLVSEAHRGMWKVTVIVRSFTYDRSGSHRQGGGGGEERKENGSSQEGDVTGSERL